METISVDGYQRPTHNASNKPIHATSAGIVNFWRWFGDSAVVDDKGRPKVVYHGTKRPDRIGNRFRKARATSGPMAYFTESADVAAGYASGKQDTSIEINDWSETYYIMVGKKRVSGLKNIWYRIPLEYRAEFIHNLLGIGHDDNENWTAGVRGYVDERQWKYEVSRHKGNWLMAAFEIFVNSGALHGDEEEFCKLMGMAGIKGVRMEHPYSEFPAVYAVYLFIQNPFVTSDIPLNVVNDINRAGRRQPSPKYSMGADHWDKRTRDPAVWLDVFNSTKDSYLVWTSIPDWVTKVLKKHGYDGIMDTGGKTGGMGHIVWIPFDDKQVKSAVGNRGTFLTKSKLLTNPQRGPATDDGLGQTRSGKGGIYWVAFKPGKKAGYSGKIIPPSYGAWAYGPGNASVEGRHGFSTREEAAAWADSLSH